jgi:hypothetical protein
VQWNVSFNKKNDYEVAMSGSNEFSVHAGVDAVPCVVH